MANRTDLARLREQTIGGDFDEEAVTVNTRALIDKVLARYSGDWTTLRELIQNAADASAKKVVIRFETLPSKTVPVPNSADDSTLLKHTLLNHTIYRLVVSNDGEPFAESDWNRLKRIAEGNPDEQKIGAFGVGFYSVFADCEEPFVVSGRKTMAFMWKGNSLFTKSSTLPTEQSTQDTCFFLNYRNTTSPVPELMSICKFLSTSLTFVGLEAVELFLDNWNVFTLTKKSAPGATALLPKDINPKTEGGMMKVVGVIHQSTQIDARWMNAVGWSAPLASQALVPQEDVESQGPSLKSFFSRLKAGTSGAGVAASRKAAKEAEHKQQVLISENLTDVSRATVFLRISTVNIQTYVSASFARELERATKKPPPKHTRIAILTSSHDETTASLSTVTGITSKKAADLFSSVLPTKHGKIFIGFPTAQTTGVLCHISAPSVIPTVERESIDLNARWVKDWNLEMLRVAGIACRIAYMGEMEELKLRIQGSMKSGNRTAISAADVNAVVPQAIHVFKQYTAVESTPSSQVGHYIEQAFWTCAFKSSINVLSTKGVLPSEQVRVVTEPLSFLENVPTLPESLTTDAQGFVAKLYNRNLVTDMSIRDIRTELESRSLDDAQLGEFLKWLATQLTANQLDTPTVQSLLSAGVATISEDGNSKDKAPSTAGGKVLVLAQVKTFLTGSKIPPDLPLPPDTIPFRFTKGISRQTLEAFQWVELQVVPWVRFLLEAGENSSLPVERCLTQSPEFAAQVLHILSKSWDSLSQSSKTTIEELLSKRTIIPTKFGLRRPAESYFPSVKLFDDLPTIMGLHSSVKDKFLAALGVRKTVEMNVVFERLMSPQKAGSPKWSFTDLVHYLVSVKDDIPKQDLERLRSTAICPVEENSGTERRAGRLHKLSDLYEPKDLLRDMGLPVLHWPGVYRSLGPEGKFLGSLGLKRYPEVPQLVKIMQQAAARSDYKGYMTTIKYFIDYHHPNGYGKFNVSTISNEPFLPTQGNPFPALSAPSACYWNQKASAMGYVILQPELHPHAMKFGVAQDPPIQSCATRLINAPPKNQREAAEMFAYMATRLGEINRQTGEVIGSSSIVPVVFTRNEKRLIRFTKPQMTFLGDPDAYGDILDFVDFGMEANSFLLKVGSKHEPSSLELARMVVDNPSRILGTLETSRYTDLLRKIAENQTSLKADKVLWANLRSAACLLSYKERPSDDSKASSGADKAPLDEYPLDEDEATVRVYSLSRASEIVIADSIREFMMFRDHISIAPQDDVLEKFYVSLGVPTLTSLVEADHRVGNLHRDQSNATKLRKHIVERSRLFLHEYSRDTRHDAKWLDSNLAVTQVDSISLTSRLRGYGIAPHREKRTAVVMKDRSSKYTLFIMKDPDLYEISSSVVKLLLTRPKQHDTLALEMVLGSDLRKLRTKGYNVDRILRQKAYETRIAEDERRKQLADEEKRSQEQRHESEKERSIEKDLPPPPPYSSVTPGRGKDRNSSSEESALPSMPGAFGSDSPDAGRPRSPIKPDKKPNTSLFSSFQDSIQQWATERLGVGEQPNVSQSQPESSRQGRLTGPSGSGHDANPAESERNITQNLSNAVQACRSATSNSVFSKPRTTTVEEAKGSYCDSAPAQDLSIWNHNVDGRELGVQLFIANSVQDPNKFIAAEGRGIHLFEYILSQLAFLYNLPKSSLHIFYDNRGATIAFNQGGALFFNYHYFQQLHLDKWSTSRAVVIDCQAYWFITMAHELAHNLVEEHSARHSFYAEAFAQQYLGKLMANLPPP